MKIPVEVSARHVHLSQEAVDTLFGKGHKLIFKKNLSQPGQFVCEERVAIIGSKGEFSSVAVLGPVRDKTQVEVSITDAIKIGVPVLIRESGDLNGTPGVVLKGPNGIYEVKEGLIIAKRHIHINPSDAETLNVNNGEIVKVNVKTEFRSLVFDDVVVRVSPKFALAMHIDTDEGNAAGCKNDVFGEIL